MARVSLEKPEPELPIPSFDFMNTQRAGKSTLVLQMTMNEIERRKALGEKVQLMWRDF